VKPAHVHGTVTGRFGCLVVEKELAHGHNTDTS
jgi:hypothetical protein